MVVQAVMRGWLISRQQTPLTKQKLPDFSNRELNPPGFVPETRLFGDESLDEDAAINVEKRLDVVPRRRGPPPRDDDYWTSHLFWKGIVLGLFLVVLVKTVMEVQTPFGIDWYSF